MSAATEPAAGAEIGLSVDAVRAEVAKFNQIEAGLAALKQAHPKDVVCEVTTPAGMEQALVARRAWREPRIAVEKARQAAKAPVLALGRMIDKFAGNLEKELRLGEDHYDEQIKVEERRKEAERERLRQIEAERVAEIRRRIVSAFAPPTHPKGPAARWTSAELESERDRVDLYPIDESFGDLKIEAQEARVRSLAWLEVAIGTAKVYEREQAEAKELREQQAAEREAEKKQADAERVERERLEGERRTAQEAELAQLRADKAAAEAEVARLKPPVAEAPPPPPPPPPPVAAPATAEPEWHILAIYAPDMHDCLRQWLASERDGDFSEFQNAREERDRILSSIANHPLPTTKATA